ncbi:MAG TPA: hypothetical protein VFK47_15530 [Ktedonobacteraceae bacterium]|nr:hypothetical protein [Ktedonobacteraceae bacterium]
MTEGLAFVNDWGILSRAVEDLSYSCGCYRWGTEECSEHDEAVNSLKEWVPKLIDSWSELWELSLNLVALVEAQKLNETPAGIYLPDTAVRPPERL